MGQYYRPTNRSKKENLSPYDYNNGAKLMEHSWFGNKFVAQVMLLLEDRWKGDRISWEGDYADEEVLIEPEKPPVLFDTPRVVTGEPWSAVAVRCSNLPESVIKLAGFSIINSDAHGVTFKVDIGASGEYVSSSLPPDLELVGTLINWYDYDKVMTIKPDTVRKTANYLLNTTKMQYVDLRDIPEDDGWRIHALPLLTANGNNRGGGDYRSEVDADMVGAWCGDRLEASRRRPSKDFEQIFPKFKE